MKAVQFSQYGGPSTIEINDIPKPTVGPGQVMVEVHATSLNPFDSKIREGFLKEYIPLQLPVTLGGDLAGIVAEVGEGVTELAVGDPVYGQANAVAGDSGAFAEFAVSKSAHLAHAPQGVSLPEAASLALVGVSALQGLQEHLQLSVGQKILIQGGSGGIGTAAIQLAKEMGAYVATTVAADAIDFALELGADEAYDYQTVNIEDKLEGYDAVFDTVGGDSFVRSLDVLGPKGVAVTLVGPVDKSLGSAQGVTVVAMSTKVTTAALDELSGYIRDGVVTPHIDKEFPLDQARQAFTARETERVLGKVVLLVKE